MTRYVVIGAGAIGGALGGRLSQHGADTVLVARGEHAEALAAKGLRLRTPYEDVIIDVRVVTDPSEVRLTLDTVLVVATKTHQLEAALLAWADRPVYADGSEVGTAGQVLPLCTALNGVASEPMAARYFRRVIGVCVWVPAVHLVPGEVLLRAAAPSGMFHVGHYPSAAAAGETGDVLERITEDWTTATFKVAISNDVMCWKYRKLIDNVGNSVHALVGHNGDTAAVVATARDEARAVLRHAGIAVTSDEDEAAVRDHSFTAEPVPGQPPELGGSTWQSLARGKRRGESDYLNGEIAKVARQHGIDAPINAKLAELVRIAASSGQRPGDLPADALRDALGLGERDR